MFAIVGLGNPGREYERTRHNAGFWAIDELAASQAPGSSWSSQNKCEKLSCSYEGEKLLLLKPLSYMNLSGAAIAPLIKFHKLEDSNVIVLHDDLDIDPGSIRLKRGGSSGGHNGLKDISSHLGSQNYFRVRIGIGRPHREAGDRGGEDISPWVLGRPRPEDRELLEKAVILAADAVKAIISEGLASAQRRFN
ncbi:UNVERIFIED_CONTAM: hypothetical protein GTU68_019049 [Idotea baltica]|nr:hypothetical protein [Idotea baltica]